MRSLLKALSLFVLSHAALAAAPTVESFAPQGVVKQVRQVTARFSSQMVAFGDLRAPDPFVVDCPEKGRGRWIDGSTWSYDFERDLPGAVACRFTLADAARDLAGQGVTGESSFGFNTGGPAVVQSLPEDGQYAIDESQVFILGVDAVAREDSIVRHAWCQADGINEKIGVRVLAGAERERFLELRRNFVNRYLEVYFRARGVIWRAGVPLRARRDEQLPVTVLQCQRPLPANAKVALVWGAGIRAGNGIATDQDQRLIYRTRPNFTAKVHCDRLNSKSGCIPFLPVRLGFSAPVAASAAARIYMSTPDGKRIPAKLDVEDGHKTDYVNSLAFKPPFPESSTLTLHLPPGLKDDAGRTLVNRARFPLALKTGEQPPLVKFSAPFGIVEARGDRMLPVTVRNVEPRLAGQMRSVGASLRMGPDQEQEVIGWLKAMTANGASWDVRPQWGTELETPLLAGQYATRADRFTLPKPNGRQAFEVIGIPLRRPGFYVVELASPRLGAALNKNGKTAYVRTAALVTNMTAHLKLGAQSSLVWVTSLDKGKPVAGADVMVRDCSGKELWRGATDAEGVARIETELPESHCNANSGYFVSAKKGEDFTFALSQWQEGIESWRFNLPTGRPGDDTRLVATVFDRTLLRAGETVHMKHFLRRHTQAGFAFVQTGDKVPKEPLDWRFGEDVPKDKGALPDKAWLLHQGSNEKFELPLQWDAAGNAQGEWKIPKQAKLGAYDVLIGGQQSGSFRVEQFRVPTMKAVLSGPQQAAVAPRAVTIDAQVSYLSGGPASLAPVKLATVVQDRSVSFAGYDGFTFGAGDVKEGLVKRGGGFDEDEGEWIAGEGNEARAEGEAAARTQSLTLDRAGGARIEVDQLPRLDKPKALLAELSFQDANGETSTVSSSIPLWPSQYVVGIKPADWMQSRDALKFEVAVLDVNGKPVAGVPVAVDLFRSATYSHRRRLVGGFYAYENVTEVKRLGAACQGQSGARGLLLCTVKAPSAGNLILRARAVDAEQRAAVTQRDVWVAGKEDSWFSVTDNDRIDLLPAKKRFEPGEQASFQVRSPFREATALITVEREGVLDTYIRQVSGREPVITIPVKGSYAPNVYVSAMLVRGRVAGVQPTALVDLGKPAYKLGIVPIRVGWAAHELKVQVSADKPVYKVRERAAVRVKVTRLDGSVAPGAEVALAAVDAGLLELMPNASWSLLEVMMHERSLQVQTSTAQMQVVGKRHFGRKAVPHGGGGGRGLGRELFDTLLLWKGKVTLDANGEAQVEVPLNDSLTSFKIVAVASSGAGLFGTGQTEVRSTQDLMLLSGLPQLVREGDAFRAGFTLRNTSAGELKVALTGTVTADGGKPVALAGQTLTLAPGQAQEVGWDYTAPLAKGLQWQVEAKALNGGAADRIRISQNVESAVPVRTLQATLLQLNGPQSMKVERPADALPGHGGVLTTFSAKLGGDLPGVRQYMSAYPYTCFEQNVSRAVALRDAALWKANMASLSAHLDADGMVKYFALMENGSDSLTAYVLSVASEAGYDIPQTQKEQMVAALVGFVEGKVIRGSGLASGDLAVRKLAALEALSRSAHVQPSMLESFTIEPNLWPTSALLDWYQVLKRTPSLPERDARMRQAESMLRARLNLQGTTLGFSTERRDDLWWLMASADVNANRLLLAMLDNPAWQADMGRLARGTLGRQQQGRWGTTLANAWGVLAIEKFSTRFEAQPVTGTASVSLAGGGKALNGTVQVPGSTLQAWPERTAELTLRHQGTGKPWVTVQSLAAVPLAAPLSSGYRIVRTVTPVEQKVKGAWSRGDIYRVHLDLEAQSDMTWVVVNDPVPAGATILGSGLGRDSQIAASGERQRGWVEPAFRERAQDSFRSYFEFVPKGKWSIEYTVRLNNQGRFSLPPTRVEALYSPEMFGELPNAQMVVTH